MLNIVIPMAGEGSRFKNAGFHTPKPFIQFANKMMIDWVVDNLSTIYDFRLIFLVREEHLGSHYGQKFVEKYKNTRHVIVPVRELTEGTACTLLLAKDLIDNDNPLIVANSDQFIEWIDDIDDFIDILDNYDGVIATFNDTDPKWSFTKVDENNLVTEVAEKNPISDIATCGIYGWKKGSDFVVSALSMISKNIRVNNEFYTVPTYNELIQAGKKITIFPVKKMWGLGTPPDLLSFINKYVLEN